MDIKPFAFSVLVASLSVCVHQKGFGQCDSTELSPLEALTKGFFGSSLALTPSGDVAAVGMWSELSTGPLGAVWVFENSDGKWVPQAMLSPSNSDDSGFGRSVAITSDGETIAIGSTNRSHIGSVFVFNKLKTGEWIEQQELQPVGVSPGDQFGQSVAISSTGDRIVAGARFVSSYYGAAYVFRHDDSGWVPEAKLDQLASQVAEFGYDVGMSANGDRVIVGAPSAGENEGDGRAFVFVRNENDWSLEEQFESGIAGAFFGSAVDISADGSTVLIGAPLAQLDGSTGAAFACTRTDSWSPPTLIVPCNLDKSNWFGISVSLAADGETALVGDSQYNFANSRL